LIADRVPVWVVFILFTVFYVIARNLNVPISCRANPNSGPRGRNDQPFNPGKYFLVFDRDSIKSVGKTCAVLCADYAWTAISNVFQASDCSRALIIPMHFD
jgi:hypothetical protein